MNLLFGHDGVVGEWVFKKRGTPLRDYNFAIGIIDRDGVLIGCASFHYHTSHDIEICFFGPWSLTSSIARQLMIFCFDHLRVSRVTARTPRSHKRMIRFLPVVGFKMEGVMRHYYGPRKKCDAIVFGLLERDARRFIRGVT